MPMRRVIVSFGLKQGFLKLKTTAGIDNTRNGPYGVLNKSYQQTQYAYLSSGSPYQQ
jgi:hypothetical protein